MTRLGYLSSGPRGDHGALVMEHAAERVRACQRSQGDALGRSHDPPVGLVGRDLALGEDPRYRA
jgi:hypothetical protein